jgi:hypothetical protein
MKSPCRLCACVTRTFDRQRLGKHVPAAMNTHATTELLDAVFSMRSVSYQILSYVMKYELFSSTSCVSVCMCGEGQLVSEWPLQSLLAEGSECQLVSEWPLQSLLAEGRGAS